MLGIALSGISMTHLLCTVGLWLSCFHKRRVQTGQSLVQSHLQAAVFAQPSRPHWFSSGGLVKTGISPWQSRSKPSLHRRAIRRSICLCMRMRAHSMIWSLCFLPSAASWPCPALCVAADLLRHRLEMGSGRRTCDQNEERKVLTGEVYFLNDLIISQQTTSWPSQLTCAQAVTTLICT